MLLGPGAAVAAAELPYNNEEPEVEIKGRLVPGERLVCAAGSWEGGVFEFKYEWLREGSVIAGASGSVYFIAAADRGYKISCIVFARNAEGTEFEESWNSVEIPGTREPVPINKVPPHVTGTPAVGKTLTCSSGTWESASPIKYAYQWLREKVPVETATQSTYLVAEADRGYQLSCKVTATNTAGSAVALSDNALKVPGVPPSVETPPQVLGTAGLGKPLTCNPGAWSGAPPPTFTYIWLRDGGEIPGATGATYTPVTADQLHSLSCKVTATNSEGSATASSSNSAAIPGSAPVNEELPKISGVATVGEKLTCAPGKWGGAPAPTFSYKWLRDGEAISVGGTTLTYTVVEADRAHQLVCEVTATNTKGSASAASTSVHVPGISPVNKELPKISGTPSLGSTLSCSSGTWTGVPAPTFAYAWLRNGSVIGGAAGSTYTVAAADELHLVSCRVTATNSEGSAASTSNAVEIAGTKPADETPPTITGALNVGSQLTCNHGIWSGAPTPTFEQRWLREGVPIPGATAATHLASEEDVGHALTCEVVATNSLGAATAVSAAVFVAAGGPNKPKNLKPPTVSGTPEVGGVLECSGDEWEGPPKAPTAFTYAWSRDNSTIAGAASSSYNVVEADAGHTISCAVTAANSEGATSSSSSNSLKVPGSKPVLKKAPQISGNAVVGETLTCGAGEWKGAPTPALSYVWLREGSAIPGANTNSYVVSNEDGGHQLACKVTATNTEGSASATTTPPLNIPGIIPQNTVLPVASGTPVFGHALSCSPGSWTAAPNPTFTYQWMRENVVITGATESTYVIMAGDQGLKLACRVRAQNSQGVGNAESQTVKVVGIKPEPTPNEPPVVSGSPTVGESLSCAPGAWKAAPAPTFAYHWLNDGTVIASGNSYVVKETDRGHVLVCEVTATNNEGSGTAKSEPLEIAGVPPGPVEPPSVAGPVPPAVGDTLTCEPGKWYGKPAPVLTYQWLTDGGPIAGATESTYKITKLDEGHHLACEVTATNPAGVANAESGRVHIPGLPPTNLEAPTVEGVPQVGELLTCSPGLWRGKPAPAFKYQWLIDGQELPEVTTDTFTAEPEDLGGSVSCRVVATNSEGTAELISANNPEIVPRVVRKLEVGEVPKFNPPPPASKGIGKTQVLASLTSQLSSLLKKIKASAIFKRGGYAFTFLAPAAGTLEVLWYQVPKGAHLSAKIKPILVARSKATFTGAVKRTIHLQLTTVGRSLLSQSAHIKLTAKGVFLPKSGTAATWLKTFTLH
jgi:hypothetical protein